MTLRFESINTEEPLPHDDAARDKCVLVDLNPAPDQASLNACVTEILATLGERFAWSPSLREGLGDALQRHVARGPDAFSQGVAVIHESFPGLSLPVQILIRLPSGLKLCDALGRNTVFVWLLISSEETHPAMGSAVEFGKLMAERRFRKEALAAENVEALEVAYHAALEREVHFRAHIPEELRPTGKLFGGLRADIARRRPRYLSDYFDGLTPKTLASVFFLFFACFAPAVAFGGLLSELTGGAIGAIEMIVATAIAEPRTYG